MGNIFNIEEYCKDTKSTLSMQDVEINDYNKDYVILVAKGANAKYPVPTFAKLYLGIQRVAIYHALIVMLIQI